MVVLIHTHTRKTQHKRIFHDFIVNIRLQSQRFLFSSSQVLKEPRYSLLSSPGGRDGISFVVDGVQKDDQDDYVCEVNLKDKAIRIKHRLEVLGESCVPFFACKFCTCTIFTAIAPPTRILCTDCRRIRTESCHAVKELGWQSHLA